jgi:hypothetical protein
MATGQKNMTHEKALATAPVTPGGTFGLAPRPDWYPITAPQAATATIVQIAPRIPYRRTVMKLVPPGIDGGLGQSPSVEAAEVEVGFFDEAPNGLSRLTTKLSGPSRRCER